MGSLPDKGSLPHELHQQPWDGDEPAADGIGREPKTFEGVSAEERQGARPSASTKVSRTCGATRVSNRLPFREPPSIVRWVPSQEAACFT